MSQHEPEVEATPFVEAAPMIEAVEASPEPIAAEPPAPVKKAKRVTAKSKAKAEPEEAPAPVEPAPVGHRLRLLFRSLLLPQHQTKPLMQLRQRREQNPPQLRLRVKAVLSVTARSVVCAGGRSASWSVKLALRREAHLLVEAVRLLLLQRHPTPLLPVAIKTMLNARRP